MALPSNYKQIALGAPTVAPVALSGSTRSRSSTTGGSSDRNKEATPIFTHSNYGNPAFAPQKVSKLSNSKSQSESRVPKPPKPPEKPILPYMRYSKRVWDNVKAQYPELKLWDLGRKIGAMWKHLNEYEKQEFIEEYKAEKSDYEKALKSYHQTPAYQAYISAKSKVKTDADMHELSSRGGGSKGQHERRIDIQPAEDEDDQDEGYSIKHLAYARYLRNHRLINEIFSDSVVPDVRSVVTTQRMQVLKRQVSSLTMHQTKLEAELQQMEEKFEAKKQRMVESSDAFQKELKRHCKPAVDDETFQNMVQRMYEDIKRDRQRFEEPNMMVVAHTATKLCNRASEEKKLHNAHLQVTNSQDTQANSDTMTSKQAESVFPSNTILPKQPPVHETGSKTDPEPMDIEPNPEPSVPTPPIKTEKLEAISSVPPSAQAGLAMSQSLKENSKNPSTGKVILSGDTSPIMGSGTNTSTNNSSSAVPLTIHQQQLSQHSTSALSAAISTNTMPLMHPHHIAPPGHTHIAPHMSHQSPAGMPGITPHSGYGNYAAPNHGPPTGSTRSPYYQPQFSTHPTAQSYGQYAPPYSHYQQPYHPQPGSHYLNSRTGLQSNGSTPVHYGAPDHGNLPPPAVSQQQSQQSTLSLMHDAIYAQSPATHNVTLSTISSTSGTPTGQIATSTTQSNPTMLLSSNQQQAPITSVSNTACIAIEISNKHDTDRHNAD